MSSELSPGTISLAEAAKRLDLSTATVRRYIRLGVISAAKVRGHWQVHPTSVENVLRGREPNEEASIS